MCGVYLICFKKSPLLKGRISRFSKSCMLLYQSLHLDVFNPFVSNCKQWLSPVAGMCWLTDSCFASVFDDVWLEKTNTMYQREGYINGGRRFLKRQMF